MQRTIVHMMRHGEVHNPEGILYGRLPNFHLSRTGAAQAQRVAAERDALSALLAGGVDRPGIDLAAIGRLFTRLTVNHTERMRTLGLAA